jgi:TPR repeat protein
VKENLKTAAKWYKKVATQGHPQCQSMLGSMYDDGEGVEEDKAEAVKWYKKGAEQVR